MKLEKNQHTLSFEGLNVLIPNFLFCMKSNKMILSLITGCSVLLLLSGCNSKDTEKVASSHSHQGTSHIGMGWQHDHPVSPTAGTWKGLAFNDGNAYTVEAPPANDSATTKSELEELAKITANLTPEEIERINYWQYTPSPNTHWFSITEELIEKYKLSGPESARVHAVVSGAIYTSLTATFDVKYEHLRPRPTDLDPSISLPENFNVPAHPAYPSGHTSTAWAAAYILSHFFPNEKEMLEDAAEEVAFSREQAGIHFNSDNEASKKLAEAVTKDIIDSLKADKHAPWQYTEIKEGPGGH
ncbi:phosphatase PAP2 family protein [Ammoniphilus sp. YIM 78166]|uniref:phosphatase PAP2 family protein n=1 Tax=Ammoniphilus sp. YIM 78166 TaxID=1644106 RepID=UPI001F0EEE6F|nr:phosphatase PAP2 family protein [Ammoniphilus sp. YIM 78166]